jgi:hypothetical protein
MDEAQWEGVEALVTAVLGAVNRYLAGLSPVADTAKA